MFGDIRIIDFTFLTEEEIYILSKNSILEQMVWKVI
jgi:hypothetical protein